MCANLQANVVALVTFTMVYRGPGIRGMAGDGCGPREGVTSRQRDELLCLGHAEDDCQFHRIYSG